MTKGRELHLRRVREGGSRAPAWLEDSLCGEFGRTMKFEEKYVTIKPWLCGVGSFRYKYAGPFSS